MNKLNDRDGECIEYIRANADKNEPLFIHAIKYDDGSIDLSFRLSNMLRRVRQEMQGLEDNDPVYYICDAKGNTLYPRKEQNYSDSEYCTKL